MYQKVKKTVNVPTVVKVNVHELEGGSVLIEPVDDAGCSAYLSFFIDSKVWDSITSQSTVAAICAWLRKRANEDINEIDAPLVRTIAEWIEKGAWKK